MASYDKILDLLAYADLIGMKGVKKDVDDETKPCKLQAMAYWHYLNTVPDERIDQLKPKLQGKFFPSAPELKDLITGLRTVNDSPDVYTPLSADRQIEDPSQQPMTAAEWKSKNPEKFASMMAKIKSGNNKFGGNFAKAAKDLGLIGAKPASPAPRFSSVAEAKKELESRSPEVQAKIKQLAELKHKIEFAEAWCEEKKDLDHETAKRAAERLSAIYAESNLLEEELNKLGVCA